MKQFYWSLAGLLLLVALPAAASAGWGFSYHQSYVPRPHHHHHHHYPPPYCGPYGGYVERHYYPPPRSHYYAYPPPYSYGPPRGSIWIGF
jgi:hypothetical protein